MVKKVILLFICGMLIVSTALASGIGAGQQIQAVSTNLKIEFSDGGGGTTSKTASEFSIGTDTKTVIEINGLVETNQNLASLGAIQGSIYRGFTPGTDYSISYTYLNRGNSSDDVDLTATKVDPLSHWTLADTAQQTIAEDATYTFWVTFNPTTALSYERATLNIETAILNPVNVVSYNAFSGAVGDMQNNGYGGVGTFNYSYTLEAEGFDVAIFSRSSEIVAPAGAPAGQPVPGAKITYTIVLKNNSTAVAAALTLKDKIPASCHMYYHADNYPDVLGEYTGTGGHEWVRADDFAPQAMSAAGTDVVFSNVYVPAEGYVTLNYTVTID